MQSVCSVRTGPYLALLVTAVVFLAANTAATADWPHWRGANRDDVSSEDSGWTKRGWPPGMPLWTANVGQGCTSPIIVSGRLYTMGWKENKDRVCCLEASSGKKLWEVSYRCPEYGRHHKGDEGAYSGPTATPEFDSKTGYLYTLSNDGDLNCLDTHKQGRRVWTTNLYATYGVPRRPEVGSGGIHR